MEERRWGRAAALGAGAAVLTLAAAVGLGACGDEAAATCVDQAGARFCVTRQGKAAVEPTATGLKPGTDWSAVLTGDAVPKGANAQPRAMQVSPDGSAGGMTMGILGLVSKGVPDGTRVVFTATAADGTPVTATVVVGG
jgi:hypothetical protein